MKISRHYLLQTDNNYLKHMLVTILSIRKHAPEDENSIFYIVDDRISEENKEFIRNFAKKYECEMIFLDGSAMSALLEEKQVPKWRGGYTTYLKILALNQIEGVERILYLDSDVIIQNDISDVFAELDGVDSALAMAEDMTISFNAAYKRYALGEGGEKRVYYNAGAILFDIPRWRDGGYEEKVLHFIQTNTRKLMYCEQDILNILFGESIKTISNRYNYCTPILYFKPKMMGKLFGWNAEKTKEYADMAKDYGVGHCFAVFQKRPWHANSRHPLTEEYRALYEELFEERFVGLPVKLTLTDRAQILLYDLFRPLYAVLHRHFTKKLYQDFFKNA